MFCINCGVELPENASFCSSCGAAQSDGQSAFAQPASAPPAPGQPPVQINSHLVGSILVTLACCLPFGIVSIVYASRVSGLLAANRIAEAVESSNKAATWMWWGFGLGIVAQIIGITIHVLAAVATEAGAL